MRSRPRPSSQPPGESFSTPGEQQQLYGKIYCNPCLSRHHSIQAQQSRQCRHGQRQEGIRQVINSLVCPQRSAQTI